jgi:MFS family permease
MSKPTPTDASEVPPHTDALPAADAKVPAVAVTVGFLILGLSFMVNAMDRQIFAPLLPTIREEYGFSLQAGGLLATVFTLGMALAGLPAGYLVDRFSRKTVLLVSIVIYSVGTLATPLASGWASMAVYRIISGFGEGMQAAALFAAVGAFFHRQRGLALGALGVAFGLGVIVGPLLGVGFAADFGTWRAPFVLFGISGLIVTLIAVFAVSRRITERSAGAAAVSDGSYDYMPPNPYNRNSIALAVASAIGGVILYGFFGLYPTFLVSELHLTTGQSALALSFVGFGGLAGILGGWIGDRVDQRNLLIGSLVAMSITSLLIFQVQASLGWQLVFAFLMGAFGTGVLFPNANSAIQRAVRPNQVGRAAGLFVTCYYGPAAFSGLLFGALVAGLGWRQAGLWQMTLLPLVAVVALAFVRTSQFNNAVRQPAR